MSKEIIQIFDHICEKVGLAIDWTSGNIMPYFTELCDKVIKYEICTSVILAAVFALAIVLCVIFARNCIKEILTNKNGCGEICVILLVLFVIALFISLNGFINQTFDIIKCCVFPEKYLFEYFSNFLKRC